MTITSTVRYAAKSAYQLMLMRGIYESKQCGMVCEVRPCDKIVRVYNAPAPRGGGMIVEVPIAKAWANL